MIQDALIWTVALFIGDTSVKSVWFGLARKMPNVGIFTLDRWTCGPVLYSELSDDETNVGKVNKELFRGWEFLWYWPHMFDDSSIVGAFFVSYRVYLMWLFIKKNPALKASYFFMLVWCFIKWWSLQMLSCIM